MLSFFLSLHLPLTFLFVECAVSDCAKCDAGPDICEECVAGYKLSNKECSELHHALYSPLQLNTHCCILCMHVYQRCCHGIKSTLNQKCRQLQQASYNMPMRNVSDYCTGPQAVPSGLVQ